MASNAENVSIWWRHHDLDVHVWTCWAFPGPLTHMYHFDLISTVLRRICYFFTISSLIFIKKIRHNTGNEIPIFPIYLHSYPESFVGFSLYEMHNSLSEIDYCGSQLTPVNLEIHLQVRTERLFNSIALVEPNTSTSDWIGLSIWSLDPQFNNADYRRMCV